MTLQFTVPGKPQGKARPRFNTRTHTAYTPEATRRYERLIGTCAKVAAMPKALAYPTQEPVHMHITAVFKPPKSTTKAQLKRIAQGELLPSGLPDVDNIAKAVLDGCNGVLYNDDRQVAKLTVSKIYGPEAQLTVTCTTVDGHAMVQQGAV